MLGIAFIVFIAGLIYFRHDLLLCFGLKGLARWLGTFIVGFVIIQLAWPPANIGWMTILPILFTLIAKVRYDRLYSSSSFCSEQSWELEKAVREHAAKQAFEESRAIVPKHVEPNEPKPDDENEAS